MDRVLIVEDADTLRDVLKTVLEEQGYCVDACASAEEASRAVREGTYSLILSDFKLPGMNGVELLRDVREVAASVPFLVMTAYGSIDVAVEAMKYGANDFICKPFEPHDICDMVRDVIKHRQLRDRRLGRSTRRPRSFVSRDENALKVLEQAKKAAKFESSVLILGESGTGKELVARYIHEHSDRANEEFVSINCAALPGELLESEFFGHEAGAFTGATQTRVGLFEVASKGTVFLDEIGDMPASLQVKLLRALQEREIKRVGGNKKIKVNPRIVAATNVDIEGAISNGTLREDFYYRVAVISLMIPALRERKNDIELLTDYFVEYFSGLTNREAPVLDDIARDVLQMYRWPGNVRELENVIERAVVMAEGVIKPEHLGISMNLDFEAIETSLTTLPEIAGRAASKAEIDAILKTLERTRGNKTRAAEYLGVSYKTLLNKIKDYQLQ